MNTQEPIVQDRDRDYYRDRFRELFEEFTRDVLVHQVDYYMNMVGFHRWNDDPLQADADEDFEEKKHAVLMVFRYRNAEEMEFDFRFSFDPLGGPEFNIDFQQAGMLINSGPYDKLDLDGWQSIMDTIEDGEDEISKQRDRQRFTVVK
jgi:hypothetical protein